MKRPNPFALFFSVLLLLGLTPSALQSCAGAAARTHALLPAMQTAWPAVRAGVERELAVEPSAVAAAALAAADEALAAGTPLQVAAVDWPLLERIADQDVARRLAAGSIGEGVAASLRERLARFTDARTAFVGAR